MRSVVNVSIVLLLFLTPALAQASVQNADDDVLATRADFRHFDCDQDGSLADRVKRHQTRPHIDGVVFSGTCNLTTPAIVERDGYAIIGTPGASIVGGGVIVQAAKDVTLKDFTIRGVGGVGISVTRNSEVTLQRVTAEASDIGVAIRDSVALIEDLTVRDGALEGILVVASRVTLGGTIDVSNAGFIGIDVSSGSMVSGDAAGVDVVSTGQVFGMAVQLNSAFSLPNGSLTVNENTDFGLIVIGQSSFAQGGSLEANNNGNRGVGFFQTSTWSVFGGATSTTTINDNAMGGTELVEGSTIIIAVATEIRGNDGPGLLIDGSVAYLSNLTAEDNAAEDVLLRLGATVTFDFNNTFGGPVVCEGTVLTRGTAGCDVQAQQAGQLQEAATSHRSGAEMLEILQRKRL